MGARTVFAFLYVGAVEGFQRWIRPSQVYSMGDEQAKLCNADIRRKYTQDSLSPGYKPKHEQWYRAGTRESIRDDVIRRGLLGSGRAVERPGLPTNSSRPRYALTHSFASHLLGSIGSPAPEPTPVVTSRPVQVELAGGMRRSLSPGDSSDMVKATLMKLAPRRLGSFEPIVISDPSVRLHPDDKEALDRHGIPLDPERLIPDLVLKNQDGFAVIEIVHTDGPIDENRKRILHETFGPECRLINVFRSRHCHTFRRFCAEVAWGSEIWLTDEMEHRIQL